MQPENDINRLLEEILDDVRCASHKSEARFERMDQRFELIGMTLEDLAAQLAMLSSDIKTALEQR